MGSIEYREQPNGDILVICYGTEGILWEDSVPAEDLFPLWDRNW